MKREEFCTHIDYSILWQNRTRDSIEKRSQEVLDYGLACLCCYPTDVAVAKKVIGDKAGISGVVGFPFGFETTKTKVHEALAAIDDGADEIDMVMNIARFKDGDEEYVLDELKQVVQAAKNRKKDCMVKVIIETPHLKTRKELAEACELVIESGADFVKNATGFAAGYDGSGQADYQDNRAETYENTGMDNVRAMSDLVNGRIKIKSSGAPENLEECLYYIQELGVSRIGNDNIVDWLEEAGENFWKNK